MIDCLIDNTYKTIDNKAVIYLYLINNILKDRNFKPYFYAELDKNKINLEDIENIKDFLLKNDLLKYVEKIDIVKKRILKEEKEILKIIATHPQKVPKLRKIKEIVKEIYEHDIPFAKRYLIDNDIIPMVYWDFEKNKVVSKDIPKLNMVAFDIEVYNEGKEPNPNKDPIIMASFWDGNGGKVITYKDFNHDNVEIVKNEKELIKKIIEELKKYEVIFTYNGDNFDFQYLKERAKLYNIKLELGREGEEIKIKRGISNKVYIPGRVHIDLYPIAKRLLKLTKYTLEDVVYNLFGIEKLKIHHKNIGLFWEDIDENLVEYSLQDAKYTYKIGIYFFPLEVMFSRIVNQVLFETTRMTSGQMVEYLLMKRAYLDNLIVPNKPDEKEYKRRLEVSYEGGYVKAVKGLYENIVYLDFRSLYPSIIITYNISPDTLDCDCCKDNSEKILGHWFCKKRIGLIPKTLKDLIDRRMKIKKQMAITDNKEIKELLNYEQLSLKILANSHYGYLAYPRARFYSKECAEIVTYLGRKYIKQAIEEAEKFGFKVLYIDTDGFYTTWKKKIDKDELIKKTKEFLNYINKKLPGLMELEFESFYRRALFVTKKKYAVLTDDNKIEVKGLEIVRRDWANIAKKTQKKVLEALLKEGNIKKAKKIIQETIKNLREGNIDIEDLVIYTQLTKKPEEYKTSAPHVELAKRLIREGKRVNIGDVIGYVIVKGAEKVSEKAKLPEEVSKEDIDINYYIENQILPPVLRVMEALNITKSELKKEEKQKTLDEFFT